ncbi:MAG: hypothetical protein LW628_05965 [Fimbriimonadaceae bacterium]|nr:hypothetical protein [Fimbriimonadaceae bacterium]
MILDASANKHLIKRKRKDAFFRVVCFLAATIGVILLLTFLSKIVVDGMPKLSWKFIVGDMSTRARSTGIWQAVVGSIYVMVLTAIISVPVGVAAAIYLEEFTRRKNRFTDLIQLNIANLSGVPSIVYGLLGRVLCLLLWIQTERDCGGTYHEPTDSSDGDYHYSGSIESSS